MQQQDKAIPTKRRWRSVIVSVVVILAMMFSTTTLAQADTTLCSGSSFAACINAGYTAHGYENHYTTSYWRAYAGHNCTNYVGYMLTQNGDAGHNALMGTGGEWDNTIAAHPEWGYTMNGTATVGSIAQWDPYAGYTGAAGHVAYVESVSANSITISEDNYPSGPFRWRVINVGSPDWPTRFLHIKDVTGVNSGRMAVISDGYVWAKDSLGNGGWSPQGAAATKVSAGGNRMAMLEGPGNVWAKDGLSNGNWSPQGVTATDVVVSSSGRMMITVPGGQVWAKDSLGNGGWGDQGTVASSIAVG